MSLLISNSVLCNLLCYLALACPFPRDLQFDVLPSLSLEGHAMDLKPKMVEMITLMHQVCLLFDVLLFPLLHS